MRTARGALTVLPAKKGAVKTQMSRSLMHAVKKLEICGAERRVHIGQAGQVVHVALTDCRADGAHYC